MAFLTLEDRQNSFECVVFSSVYEKYSQYIQKGEMVFVRGNVSESGEQTFKILCEEIFPLSEVRNRMSDGLQLIINTKNLDEKSVDKLQELVRQHPGTIPLYIEVRPNGNGAGFLLRSMKYKVVITDELLHELQILLGKENVVIKN